MSLTFNRRSGISIPTKYKGEKFYGDIIRHLTRYSKDFHTDLVNTSTFYLESEKYLTIPRYFPIQEYVKCKINDISHEGEDIQIRHNIIPRNNTQEEAMSYTLRHDNGILELQPGVGKTVISIFMIAEKAKKSLVLVHRDSLVDQWIERIGQFTNLTDDNISRLTSASFEDDLQSSIIIATNQTILSLLKRKRIEFLKALDKANIGIFIGDEVHTTVGAATFSECSIHIPAKVCYGLSATPYRYDGNGDIISYHLGPIFEMEDTEGTLKPRLSVILMDFQIDTFKRLKYLYWDNKFQRSRYLNLMKKSKPLILLLGSIINKFINEHRDFLVVCERIKFIDLLYESTNLESKSKFIAGSSNAELQSKAVYTTPGKCRDGVDAPWKDALVMTSPIKNINQMTGRIIRTKSGKKQPIIIDLVDIGCENIKNTFYGRRDHYLKREWDIQYLYVDTETGNIIPIDEDVAMNILKGE